MHQARAQKGLLSFNTFYMMGLVIYTVEMFESNKDLCSSQTIEVTVIFKETVVTYHALKLVNCISLSAVHAIQDILTLLKIRLFSKIYADIVLLQLFKIYHSFHIYCIYNLLHNLYRNCNGVRTWSQRVFSRLDPPILIISVSYLSNECGLRVKNVPGTLEILGKRY